MGLLRDKQEVEPSYILTVCTFDVVGTTEFVDKS